MQIAAESTKFGRGCNIETLGVFGGVPKGLQMRKLNMVYMCMCVFVRGVHGVNAGCNAI